METLVKAHADLEACDSMRGGRHMRASSRKQQNATLELIDRARRSPEATRGEVRVQVKTLDMPEDLVEVAVSLAVESLSRHGSHNHRKVAQHIKEYFDACLSPAWQCVVGQHFGSFITHSHGTFCHFFVDDVAILLFRTIPAALAGCKRRETP